MIELSESQTYYYHYDALGSVVALSDSSGDTVQTYEYTVFGEVAVEDINHPNPYMFAGRRFDIEIGLYYNRARYYNPFTGRFLQTDPIGYGAGMNLYKYCRNNSLNYVDPSGLLLRDQEPDDVISAVIYTELGQWYGLVGNWNFEQVRAWYNCEPDEIRTYYVNGIPMYIETNNGYEHLDPSPAKDESLVVVRLNATEESYYASEWNDKISIAKNETQSIIREVKEGGLWNYTKEFNGGKYDYAKNDPGGLFVLNDGMVLNGAQFGNYLAGYAGYYYLGYVGVAAAKAGGYPYAFGHNVQMAIMNMENGQGIWNTLTNPVLGGWGDPQADQNLIDRGAQDSREANGLNLIFTETIWTPVGPIL